MGAQKFIIERIQRRGVYRQVDATLFEPAFDFFRLIGGDFNSAIGMVLNQLDDTRRREVGYIAR